MYNVVGIVKKSDLSQVTSGDRVTSRMTFRFKDGSIEDETTVFSQHRTFRLLSDRVPQKGPAFKLPMETPIDAMSGRVTVRYRGDDGKEKVVTEKLDLPSDLSNRLLLTLFKNVQPNIPRTTVSYVAATPKPRIVHLVISPQGEEAFSTGIFKHKAIDYDVKVEIGGLGRCHGTYTRKATSRHQRVGSSRRCSNLCGLRRSLLRRRTNLARRSRESSPKRAGAKQIASARLSIFFACSSAALELLALLFLVPADC